VRKSNSDLVKLQCRSIAKLFVLDYTIRYDIFSFI